MFQRLNLVPETDDPDFFTQKIRPMNDSKDITLKVIKINDVKNISIVEEKPYFLTIGYYVYRHFEEIHDFSEIYEPLLIYAKDHEKNQYVRMNKYVIKSGICYTKNNEFLGFSGIYTGGIIDQEMNLIINHVIDIDIIELFEIGNTINNPYNEKALKFLQEECYDEEYNMLFDLINGNTNKKIRSFRPIKLSFSNDNTGNTVIEPMVGTHDYYGETEIEVAKKYYSDYEKINGKCKILYMYLMETTIGVKDSYFAYEIRSLDVSGEYQFDDNNKNHRIIKYDITPYPTELKIIS